MITKADIEKLAVLARIKIDEKEKEGLAQDMVSILGYIDQIKEATLEGDHAPIAGPVHNVFREDSASPISTDERDAILDEVPYREGDFVAVKKIIEQ